MIRRFLVRTAAGISIAFLCGSALAESFTLTILHTNDMHSRVEPVRIRGKLYGGYARLATIIERYRGQDPNPILLNGGDTFQGTLYFNVYEGLADLAFMNYVRFDAMAVGNHEFDRGPVPFGKFINGARFPVLAANLDVSAEESLRERINPSAVIVAGGQKIGIVGAVTPDLPTISSPGPNVKMKDLRTSVQAAIDGLRENGIDKIVLVTHVGYSEEIELVRSLRGVDVLVGGHSHTLLGNLSVEGFAPSRGPYPTVVKNADGDTALVLQAHEWGKVLGRIKIEFDARGRVARWFDAAPILVDESVPEDPVMKSLVLALQRPIEELANKVIAKSDGGVSREGRYETAMGNLIADAMLEATKSQGVAAAFMNAGGVRASLEPGTIKYGDAIAVQPFNNTLVLLDLTGSELLAALEHGARVGGGMLHVSRGTSYRIDPAKPEGSRVSDVVVAGGPLDPAKTYRLCFNSFTASGGDAHDALKAAKGRRVDTGILDIDAFVEHLQRLNIVSAEVEGRIIARSSRQFATVSPVLAKTFAHSGDLFVFVGTLQVDHPPRVGQGLLPAFHHVARDLALQAANQGQHALVARAVGRGSLGDFEGLVVATEPVETFRQL